jgi:hypothetical protein
MDDYEVCMDIVLFGLMFLSLHMQEHLWFIFFFAMQDFADEKVKDEVLLEDEKEKFKVHINFILKSS